MIELLIRKKKEYLLVFIVYLAITAIIFWHRIPDWLTNYGMSDVDTDGTLWYFWARMFTHDHAIAFDINNLLFGYPLGFDYSFIPFYSLIYELNIFAVRLFGGSLSAIVAISNLSSLMTYPIGAISGFLLSYYLTRNKYASFIAGLIFSFSYYHILMGRGAMSQNHIEFIPLYFLSLFYALDRKTVATYILSALMLSIVFMSNAYFAFFCGLFSIFFVLFYQREALKNKFGVSLKYYSTLFIILFLTNINFIISQRRVFNRQNLEILRSFIPEGQVVTTLSFFVPSVSSWFYPIINSGDNFMGYGALALGLAGLFLLRKNRLFVLLLFCFLISVLLASNIPGLFFINKLYFLVFGMFRAVSRLNILSSLFLSLMAALVLNYFTEKFVCSQKK